MKDRNTKHSFRLRRIAMECQAAGLTFSRRVLTGSFNLPAAELPLGAPFPCCVCTRVSVLGGGRGRGG